jgi:hypothetical protein
LILAADISGLEEWMSSLPEFRSSSNPGRDRWFFEQKALSTRNDDALTAIQAF